MPEETSSTFAWRRRLEFWGLCSLDEATRGSCKQGLHRGIFADLVLAKGPSSPLTCKPYNTPEWPKSIQSGFLKATPLWARACVGSDSA